MDSARSLSEPTRGARAPRRFLLARRFASERTVPAGVLIATLAWFTAGSALVARGLASETSIEESSAGFAGDDVVATTLGTPGGTMSLIAGVVVLVLCAALALGLGWAIYPLVVLGMAMVSMLALSSSVLTILLMGALVLGVVPLLSSASYAYLTGRSTELT